jgi:carbon storage regulator CsrA
MLVLARRVGQRIIITTPEGREIILSIAGIGEKSVELGFQADTAIDIKREEILPRAKGEGCTSKTGSIKSPT